MTTTTVLARNGSLLSEAVQADTWYQYLNGYDRNDLIDALADALLRAQQDEFNERLPQGCHWYMSTSEIIGPIDAVLPDLETLMEQAAEAVDNQFSAIEATVAAASPHQAGYTGLPEVAWKSGVRVATQHPRHVEWSTDRTGRTRRQP